MTWTILKKGIQESFGPTIIEDFYEDLSKLCRITPNLQKYYL